MQSLGTPSALTLTNKTQVSTITLPLCASGQYYQVAKDGRSLVCVTPPSETVAMTQAQGEIVIGYLRAADTMLQVLVAVAAVSFILLMLVMRERSK